MVKSDFDLNSHTPDNFVSSFKIFYMVICKIFNCFTSHVSRIIAVDVVSLL